MTRTSLLEFQTFLGSMENALKTIGRQGEEIAALTEEALAIQDNLTEANGELNRRQKIWRDTLEVMETMTMSGESEKNLRSVAENILKSTQAFGVLLSCRRGDRFFNLVCAGYGGASLPSGDAIAIFGSVAGRAVREGDAVWVEDVARDREYVPVHPSVVSEVEIPLLHRGKANGILEWPSTGEHPETTICSKRFSPWRPRLEAIEAENAHIEIKDSIYLVRKLQSVTNHHLDRRTHGQKGRTPVSRRAFWARTKKSKRILRCFQAARHRKSPRALSILAKPGKLTDEEMKIVRNHPLWGAELIGGAKWLDMARKICLSHHEKWDGSGYPLGLSGDEIPWEGQVVALADVYDALRSRRVYKDRMAHEEAVRIILHGDGRTAPEHFSPLMLDFFREHHEELDKIYGAFFLGEAEK